jgi:hypothetical protein
MGKGDRALILFDGFGIAVVGIGVRRLRPRPGCRVEDLRGAHEVGLHSKIDEMRADVMRD